MCGGQYAQTVQIHFVIGSRTPRSNSSLGFWHVIHTDNVKQFPRWTEKQKRFGQPGIPNPTVSGIWNTNLICLECAYFGKTISNRISNSQWNHDENNMHLIVAERWHVELKLTAIYNEKYHERCLLLASGFTSQTHCLFTAFHRASRFLFAAFIDRSLETLH